MRDGDRRVLIEQQGGRGTSNDRAATDDDDVLPTQSDLVELEQLDDRFGGRGYESRAAIEQEPDVERIQPLNVLVRRDVIDQTTLVQLSRNGVRSRTPGC